MSKYKAVTLVGTENIPVRRMDFEFDDAIPTYWFADNPVMTMVMTGLSSTFPEGERMFIRAIRRYQDQITDPVLQKEVRAFIGQEANHGKEHDTFNAFMAKKGLPIYQIMDFVHKGIARQEQLLSPRHMLAKTCALEHFTAMFAERILGSPELLDSIDERLRALWLWHAIEESEHKSVAFDVYQNQVGSYWVRVSEMTLTTVLFSFFTGLHTFTLLRASGELGNVKALRKGADTLWGKKGFLTGMMPRYLAYYRRDFHPAQLDSTVLRTEGLKRLETILKHISLYKAAEITSRPS